MTAQIIFNLITMKLSVCIFTYNHKSFIAKAIESALMQETEFDFEIVIGEDSSVDGTREIVHYYKNKYPNKIKVIFNDKNLGMMSNNINTILACSGEYIALLDGDDYWTSGKKLQKQTDFLDNNLEYSFCFHDGKILAEDKSFLKKTCCGYKNKKRISFKDVIFDVSIPTFSIVFRRNKIENYPPPWFKSLNAPDRPLFLLLAEQAPGYYLDKCWGVYRLHENGCWTGQNYQSRWLTMLQIYKKINRHFDYRFDEEFNKYQNKIYFIFSMLLVKNKELKRGMCFFKKHINPESLVLNNKWNLLYRVPLFYLFYMKSFFEIHFSKK